MLAIGDYAPTLSIPTDTDMFSLTKQGGKKVVVFFFPRADTYETNDPIEQPVLRVIKPGEHEAHNNL